MKLTKDIQLNIQKTKKYVVFKTDRGTPAWLIWLGIRFLVLAQAMIAWVMRLSPKLVSTLSGEST